ncbi:protein POLLENLESS 3 [Eutrema salsugineum]|uniref:protein POLLENLESS 3 n=1 Tax=Eutrema salsugineum TaxID=72664 RepID=UPI000CED3491|nr:protein POLLENLESS 3 [Eutrema salsugineum]
MCPCEDRRPPPGAFWTPPPTSNTRTRDHAAAMPMSERRRPSSSEKRDPFHIVHKVPSGDSPYVRAKHAQLVSKDPNRAISLFWAAINAGDRVDSALKDMAVVMKQLNRSDEGIEAIKSFRYLCPFEAQDSIDNLLLELYKKSGRIEEEAELLEHKLKTLEQGIGFGGRFIRAKKVQGKHVTMTIEQEKARVLGNLGWVHLQLHNYGIAEQHYRRALCLESDKNKMCNLAICLMRMGRIPEAKSLISDVRDSSADIECGDEPFSKSYDRAVEMLAEIESKNPEDDGLSDKFYAGCSFARGMKENKAPGIANRNYSHVSSSPASVGPNSAGLFTQPRGCKWDQRKWNYEEETRGAARKLLFEKPFGSERVRILKRGEEEPMKGKKLDHNMIHDLHEYIKDNADCMKSGSKKSWADIAEEEEEERLQAELETAAT